MENTVQKKQRFSKKIIGLIIVLSLVILCFGGKAIYNAFCYESTDNAQVDGEIIPLKTTVSGFIKNIRFTDNQKVKEGDTLIIFDTIDLSAQVAQAEAQLYAVKTGLSLSKQQIIAGRFNQNAADYTSGSAKENIDAAKAREWEAESNFHRVKNMFAQKAATQQTLDNAQTTLIVAKAQLAAIEKQYKSATEQKHTLSTQVGIYNLQTRSDDARIKQAVAQLILAKNQLSHAYVTAPCNGTISKKNVEVGQFVPAGTPLASVINLRDIWVTANFKETQLEDMHPGQFVKIKIDAFPKLNVEGKVQSFCAATGTKFSILPAENATGNFIKVTQRVPVKISISEKSLQNQLLPGMNVEVNVKVR